MNKITITDSMDIIIDELFKLDTEHLDRIRNACSSELCKRAAKDPISAVKEWTEKDKTRKCEFSVIKSSGKKFLTLSVFYGDIHYTDSAEINLMGRCQDKSLNREFSKLNYKIKQSIKQKLCRKFMKRIQE